MTKTIHFTPEITCIFTHTNPYQWPIHQSDMRKEAFISYLGFNNQLAAKKTQTYLQNKFPTLSIEIRKAKRTQSNYELKIKGLPWKHMQNTIAKVYKYNSAPLHEQGS